MPDEKGTEQLGRNLEVPAALGLEDITPERRVISFIPSLGVAEDMTIVSAPYYKEWGPGGASKSTHLMVRLKHTDDGFEREVLARELGLEPHNGQLSKFECLLDYEQGLAFLTTHGRSLGSTSSCTACLPHPHPCTS